MGNSQKGPDPIAVGARVLDRYLITERLESGGTSVVYRAADERLSRPVCVKVFHTIRHKEGIYRTSYEHFVQEAFALSKLTHPNTLRIYDFGHLPGPGGELEGAPFQVSEFMNGGTLSSVVRGDGPLSRTESVRIVQAICGALAEAHEIGIVHRDIKPKNILFATPGKRRVAKLADFGIAKALQLAQNQLLHRAGDTQVVAGRRLLMFSGLWAAPEQLAAESVCEQSDIYSLALVVIYMMTGRCVFSTNDAVEAYRERSDSDARIDQVVADTELPESVVSLFKRACSFRASDRPGDMTEFARSFADTFGTRTGVREAPEPAKQSRVETLAENPPPRAETQPGPEQPLRPVPDPDSGPGLPEGNPPRPLSISNDIQMVGNRAATFAPAADGIADVVCLGGKARVRVTFVPSERGFSTNIKGLNCFVKRAKGRPTRAVELSRDARFQLVANNLQVLGTGRLLVGSPAAGHTVFPVGDLMVAIRTDECPRVILLDFGPNAECVFIYVPMPEQPQRARSFFGRSRAEQ